MEAPRLEPGTVLAGKYRLGQRLGEGGMGTVYRAEHLVLRAPVAVKVIDREVSEGDVTLARFMREAQAAASLRSPHVVQILDYGMEGARPFMVMELLEGETLASRIERMGRLTPLETYRVLHQVARAVSKAHEAGIVHRDLKPDNVFLVHNEGDEIAKVLDFGVAKIDAHVLGEGTHTRTGSLLGTPYYMSPEQAQGNKEIDYRSDLWALGVITFECLTGKRPFSSDGLGDLVIQICIRDIPVPSSFGEVPARFDDWFLRAVAREPEHRFQSARELSDTLRDALAIPRDTTGSVPESVWSMPASLPSGAHALGPGGVAPPPASSPRASAAPTRTDDRPTRLESGARPAEGSASDLRISETAPDELPRGSQWELVTDRLRAENAPGRPRRHLSEPPPSGSGVRLVVFVAFVALVLGGGAVFLLREAGVDVPGLGAARAKKPVRRTHPGDEVPVEATKKPKEKVTGSPSAPPSTVTPPVVAPPAVDGAPPVDGAPSDTPTTPPSEGDVLDAIDEAAARLTGSPETGTGGKSGDTASGGSAAAPDGPRPELPEGLKPAPPPPAPAP